MDIQKSTHIASRKDAHKAFIALRDYVLKHSKPPHNEYLGICRNLTSKGQSSYYAAVSWYARRWPKHSGNTSYPIPSPFYDEKWKGEQLTLRLELLNFMIRETR